MISLKSFLALFVLPAGIYARDCTAAANVVLSKSSDLTLFNGCTTITGSVAISPSFSGTFTLDSVTHINGSITMDANPGASDLVAIEMPDLVEITSITLPQTRRLQRLDLRSLQTVREELVFVQGGPEESWFDLSMLESVGSLEMAGLWTNISLPSLTTATALTIATDPSWEISEDSQSEALEIHLPSLREVEWMSIRGRVSVLETPSLARVGAPNAPEPNGMQVLANYTDLQGLLLNGLEKAYGGLLLDGFISRVNLGQMLQTDAAITIRAKSPMSVDSKLHHAGVIDLSGEFEAINFSNISTAESLAITTTSSTKCAASLVEVYNNLNSPREATFCSDDTEAPFSSTSPLGEGLDDILENDDEEGSSTRWTTPSFEDVYGDRDDDKPSSPRNHGIPTAVIVLIPVIVGVTCCGLAWCCASKCATKRKEKQQQVQQGSAGDIEAPIQQVQPAVVRDRHEFSNDLPPPYSVDTPTQERSRYF